MRRLHSFTLFVSLFSATAATCQSELHFANLGDFATVEGKLIKNCKLGYRTFGNLNVDKSNVVLWTTWFTGTTADIVNYGMLNSTMDTTALFIVAVDALTNGVSASPSNTVNFPQITIRDMVNSQYQLLTKHLSIKHLKAVMGYSMGGSQALEWCVAYPNFMDKVISIAGTPKQSFYDLLLWNTQINLIENAGKDARKLSFAMERAMDIFTMNLYTPSYYATERNADSLTSYMTNQYKSQKLKAEDYLAGMKAMVKHNINAVLNGKKVNEVVKAKTLLIVGAQDHMVNPHGSTVLAKQLNASLLVLESNCGHLFVICAADKIKMAVKDFL